MLHLQNNTTNTLILTNNVSHDTTLPYTLIFKGLVDKVEVSLTKPNLSASPFRFLMFDILEPTDIQLKKQLYEVIVYSGDGKMVAFQLARVIDSVNNTYYNNSETNIFYE